MVIKSVNLETVCGITSKIPDNVLPEVAFCGRSNVGKSSLINCIMQRKSLARTSSSPGKTQTINFYNINNDIYLVDLPGYGYAKTSKKEREAWGRMIEDYLYESEKLRAVFMLVDIRHEPTADDKQMYEWIDYVGFQPVVICTKADKLSRGAVVKQLSVISKALGANEDAIILPFSARTGEGREDILDLMDQIIENEVDDEE